MQESLITFETAKLAKEKGFNIEQRIITVYNPDTKKETQLDEYGATQSLLQKWLREVHNIYFFILGTIPYYVGGGDLVEYYYNFDTYEKAFEKGLQEALKLIPEIK